MAQNFEWQTPRHGLGAVTLNGEIWLVGGATKVGFLKRAVK